MCSLKIPNAPDLARPSRAVRWRRADRSVAEETDTAPLADAHWGLWSSRRLRDFLLARQHPRPPSR